MNSDLEDFTASQLVLARAADFTKLVALQAKYAGLPNPGWYALRNFSAAFPQALHADLVHKAAVAPMSTTDATSAAPLAVVAPLAQGFIELVRAKSLIDRLGLRRVPLNTSLPVETTGASFLWTGENKPKILSSAGFSTLSLPSAKAAGIIAVTDEVVRLSQPGTVAALRDVLVKGVQLFTDTEFCDASVASTVARPGGLANLSPSSAASGTTSAACATDIQSLFTSFIAVNPDVDDARLVMSPSVAIACARATGSQTLLSNGGTLYGVPVVTTAAAANRILLLDASQAVFGDDPAGVSMALSNQALLQLDASPTDPSTASDVLTSLFQRNLWAFKAEYPVRWRLARTDAARTITGVAYA